MTRIGVINRIPVVPGCRDRVLEVLTRYVDEAREEGVGVAEVLVVGADAEDPNVVWMHETYADTDVYEDHFHTLARRHMRDGMDGLRGGPVDTIRTEPTVSSSSRGMFSNPSAARADWNSVVYEVT
ncbi:putative quinol monooxygenase [Rhodococcus sp. NPDC057529]|uniref:putative quinol monooxygenase n=1 Tax=Rhodococcus sp. NPDC057529 TaxID=3346158 RepID=UPI0036723E3C